MTSIDLWLLLGPSNTIVFLVALLERVSRTNAPEAYVLLLAQLAHAKMIMGDDEGARVDIEESSKIIDTLDGVETTVHAAYYGVAADYYKVPLLKSLKLICPTDAVIFKDKGRLCQIL